jgi:hypothetical protein
LARDLFGGLSGLSELGNLGGTLSGIVGGLAKSGLMPTDTPEGKLLAVQSELSDLKKQELELLAEIGRQAFEASPNSWAQSPKLKLLRENIASLEAEANAAKAAQEAAEAAKEAQEAQTRCPECGHVNPEGTKFCQECGSKVGPAGKKHCTSCGAQLSPGIRFCGECGARQD